MPLPVKGSYLFVYYFCHQYKMVWDRYSLVPKGLGTRLGIDSDIDLAKCAAHLKGSMMMFSIELSQSLAQLNC